MNTSDFRTSELHALNIEYFRYVRGEACDSSFNLACGSGAHYTYAHASASQARPFSRHYARCSRVPIFPLFCRQIRRRPTTGQPARNY